MTTPVRPTVSTNRLDQPPRPTATTNRLDQLQPRTIICCLPGRSSVEPVTGHVRRRADPTSLLPNGPKIAVRQIPSRRAAPCDRFAEETLLGAGTSCGQSLVLERVQAKRTQRQGPSNSDVVETAHEAASGMPTLLLVSSHSHRSLSHAGTLENAVIVNTVAARLSITQAYTVLS